jgi:hypothetical protein
MKHRFQFGEKVSSDIYSLIFWHRVGEIRSEHAWKISGEQTKFLQESVCSSEANITNFLEI